MHIRFAAAVLSATAIAFAMPAAAARVDPPAIEKDARNPPPAVALRAFQRFELAPVAMGAPWTGQPANEKALQNLQANIDERAGPVVAGWNARAAGDAPRTLKIAPEIAYVRFITGGKRFMAGAFAGNSGILVKATLSDAASGEVIAVPQFYQSANAFGAAYSFGATDKHMLIRISAMLADYLKANYDAPVGGAVMVAPGHEDASDD